MVGSVPAPWACAGFSLKPRTGAPLSPRPEKRPSLSVGPPDRHVPELQIPRQTQEERSRICPASAPVGGGVIVRVWKVGLWSSHLQCTGRWRCERACLEGGPVVLPPAEMLLLLEPSAFLPLFHQGGVFCRCCVTAWFLPT